MSEVVATAQQGLAGKYKPYPQYKDSGVEWLGVIPTHWSLHALKRTVSGCSNGIWGDEPKGEDDLIVLRVADFDRNKLTVSDDKLTYRSISEKERKTRFLKKGDLLIEKSGGGEKTLVGCVVIFDKDYSAVTSNFVAKMSPRKTYCSNFLRYAFSHLYAGRVNYPSIKQTTGIQNLDSDSYLMEHFCFPDSSDQQTIAAFLDYETARIDRLITQQQRLIDLLKEKRQAVISHAVTKGLNPDAPMKDSGVEWLGQVPEHWQCVPFGLLVSRADLGGNYLGGQEENGIPFLKMGNLGRGCIVLDKLECLEEGSSFDDAHRLSMGDFLFNTRNSLDLVGKVAVWHDELEYVLYNSNLLRVRFKKDFISSPDFMGFVFNSSGALGWLALLAKGTTSVAAIYYKDLRSMVVPIPPVDEQNAISSFISKCLSRLDTLEEKAIQSINLMNERHTALISAAVTGKIDLRGWTPPADEVAA